MKVGLIATKKKAQYGGIVFKEGEGFSASKQDGKILVALGNATYAPKAMKAKQEVPAEVKPVQAKQEQKGQYQRRDMVAARPDAPAAAVPAMTRQNYSTSSTSK